jgi:uncharacterized heparinase superfamily protein
VVLARAYRATGDVRFANEVVAQISSWIDQCPFGRGMQWRSPLELAIRVLNWVWAYDLLRDSHAFDGARERFHDSLYRHVWDIARKFSRGSSANNHLIGEAAGMFVACCYFPDLPNADRWRAESQTILEREIIEQTHEDGGGREQAFGYHGFVLQFLLAAAVVAKRSGQDLAAAYWQRLERMLEFAARMIEAGPPPAFGDADDGYVLDLGAAPGDVRDTLAIGAALFGRSDFKLVAADHAEAVRWMLGKEGLESFDALSTEAAPVQLESRAFPQSGYYLLQCGHARQPDGISVLFDCGELGLTSIAAHGHADALSFTVRAFGEDLIVDPGTYDYFTYGKWREYFRSTGAHNTISVDRADQSTMLGPFLWGSRATATVTHWDPAPSSPSVAGMHDGFTRLPNPVTHHRRLQLDVRTRSLTVSDELACSGTHEVALHFHLAESCSATSIDKNRILISAPGGTAELAADPALTVDVIRGREEPPMGWVSRRYHCRTATTTIVASGTATGRSSYVCRVRIHEAG